MTVVYVVSNYFQGCPEDNQTVAVFDSLDKAREYQMMKIGSNDSMTDEEIGELNYDEVMEYSGVYIEEMVVR